MSIIGCIVIAVIARHWRYMLVAALVVGFLGSTLSGFLRWGDMHYGSTPSISFMVFYITIGTAAFTAETAAFFAIKLGFNALQTRRRSRKMMQKKQEVLPQESKPSNIYSIFVGAGVVAILLVLILMISIQPFRDHLRKQYGLEKPKYYDGLKADTEENRVTVTELLADRDREKAALEEASKPKPQPEVSHGRTDSSGAGRFINMGSPPQERPRSLADIYEMEKSMCHMQWGLLDGFVNLCQSVDQSADAAEHYAYDVENYWIPRLQPTPLIAPESMAIPPK